MTCAYLFLYACAMLACGFGYAPIIAQWGYIVNTFCAFYGVFLVITGVEML